MKNLLFLVHRLPYPPNKGDKISSFNIFRYLSKRYRLYLATFIDDPEDRQYIHKVLEYCVDACIENLNPTLGRFASLRGLLQGEALTLPYYRNARMRRWIDDTIKRNPPDAVLIYSGALAQYVTDNLPVDCRSVLDLEDVDSDKWRSYSASKTWPLNWLYRREAERLLEYERAMAARFDVTLFISAEEAALFRRLAPEVADKVTNRIQGVDSDYFDPDLSYENPYPEGMRPLVFCGAMDYWPNIDAVRWFVADVLPQVRARFPDVLFCIVGMNPTEEVRKLAHQPGVMVTGGVPDVRPYVAHAQAAVLPLRIARGIQNKALEAMSLAKPLVATPEAMAGITPSAGFEPIIASTAQALADRIAELLSTGIDHDPTGRACVQESYNWGANLRRIGHLLDPDADPAAEESAS